MNYRAQLIGGQLKIERPKKGGTCVSCYVPDGVFQPPKSNKEKHGQPRFPAKIAKALTAWSKFSASDKPPAGELLTGTIERS
jgi:putative hemolysin